MPSLMIGGRTCHARQPGIACQLFVCLWPGGQRIPSRDPVGVRGLVTPLHKTRHDLRMRLGAAKRLHSPLAFPQGQGPERPTGIHEESSAKEPGRACDLTLTKESLPEERRKISQRANPEARDRGEHSPSILNRGETDPGSSDLISDVSGKPGLALAS